MRTKSHAFESKKVMVISFALFLALGFGTANFSSGPAHAQTRTCLSVISGNGAEGGLDPVVQFFNGTTFQNAFIIPPHVDNDGQPPDTNYAILAGTHYVAVTVDGSGAEQSDFKFKANFTLPASFANPSFSVQVHCDNQATVFLNGNNLGSQIFAEDIVNFQDPAESFSSTNAAHFVPGTNVIEFTVHNFTDKVALDFKAAICFDANAGCVDEDPPSVSCSVRETQLWPPNHDLECVGLTATITDDCDCNRGHEDGDDDDDDDDDDDGHGHGGHGGHNSDPRHGNHGSGGGNNCDDHHGGHSGSSAGQTAVEVKVYSDEPDLDIPGSGNFSPDAKNIGLQTLRLREERSGNGNGRVYLIVVKATDSTGKMGFCAKTVTVPHDQSRASKDSVEAQASAARTYFINNHMPPPGFVQVGIGPIAGPKQ